MSVKRRDWLDKAFIVAVVAASFATGAWIATKYVSPCVCVLAQVPQVN